MTKNPDNTSIIHLTITHENEIAGKIMKWLPHIVVIEPKSLKEEIDKRVTTYMNKYINI